jgi:hypothetical protein
MEKSQRQVVRASNCPDCGSRVYFDYDIGQYLHPAPMCWLSLSLGAKLYQPNNTKRRSK